MRGGNASSSQLGNQFVKILVAAVTPGFLYGLFFPNRNFLYVYPAGIKRDLPGLTVITNKFLFGCCLGAQAVVEWAATSSKFSQGRSWSSICKRAIEIRSPKYRLQAGLRVIRLCSLMYCKTLASTGYFTSNSLLP